MVAWFPRQALWRSTLRNPLAAMMLMGSTQAAATEHFQSRSAVIACVDPLATLTLSHSPPAHGHNAAWRRGVRRKGRCFTVRSGERWEWIASAEPHLLLLRREKPRPGEPPLYFSSASMLSEAAPRQATRDAAHPRHIAAAVHRRQGSRAGVPSPERARSEVAAVAPSVPAATRMTPAGEAPSPTVSPDGPMRSTPKPSGPPPVMVSPPSLPATVPEPMPPPAALMRSEQIGKIIGLFLFFGLLSGIAVLAAFVSWRLRARGRATRAAAIAASLEVIVTPTAAGSRPTQDRRASGGAVEQPVPAVPAAGALADYKTRCASMLRLAGWDARTRFPGGPREPDVVARRGAHLLALQCHLSPEPVDVQAVEDACLAREQQRSDLAAIVSRSRYTEAARQLADRTGIVLLHDHELASFGA